MKLSQFTKVLRFNRLFFWLVGSLLALNILFLAVVKNRERTKMTELYTAYETKRKALTSERQDPAQTRLRQTKEDIGKFMGSLPGRLTFPEVIVEILQILNKHGLPAISMSYKPEVAPLQNLAKYSTSFTVNGSYASLKAFLADIQNSKSLFCIEGLTLSNQSKGSELVSLNLRMAFYLR